MDRRAGMCQEWGFLEGVEGGGGGRGGLAEAKGSKHRSLTRQTSKGSNPHGAVITDSRLRLDPFSIPPELRAGTP